MQRRKEGVDFNRKCLLEKKNVKGKFRNPSILRLRIPYMKIWTETIDNYHNMYWISYLVLLIFLNIAKKAHQLWK